MSNTATREALAGRRAYTNGNTNAGGQQRPSRPAPPPPPPPVELRTRRPTGAVPWPLCVIEGGDFSGKSWTLAVLSASDKVGDCYWMDLGDGAADEYAAVPGADYMVLDHDGTWRDIIGQVEAVHRIARQAHENADKPVCLFIDSMSNEWEMLSNWARWLARNSHRARKILAQDPNAEIEPKMVQWNRARERHRRLMSLLMTFPGIVVVTARGKEVAKIGEDGQPVEGQKSYRVEGERNLGYDATVWVRLSRDAKPQIIGARSVHAGVRPGTDDPVTIEGEFSLEWLIFTALKCDPYKAHVRDLKPLNPHVGEHGEDSDAAHLAAAAAEAGDAPPFAEDTPPADTVLDDDTAVEVGGFIEQVAVAGTPARINELWHEAKTKGWLDVRVGGDLVRALITRAANRVRPPQAAPQNGQATA